jgi:hypothetical protein
MCKGRIWKAFEKAIYKRVPESLSNIINLAQLQFRKAMIKKTAK